MHLYNPFLYQVQCFDCEQRYEQFLEPAPYCCGHCGSKRIGILKEKKPPAYTANFLTSYWKARG